MRSRCTVEGCSKTINAKGLCHAHYWRQRKHGTTALLHRDDPDEFFWSQLETSSNDCWEYRGARLKAGYGRANHRGEAIGAHRLAWVLTYGDPGEMQVCHRCDNPPCCNPAHLFLGTQQDNTLDALEKGRLHPRKSIPDVIAKEIKGLVQAGWSPYNIAEAYDVGVSAVKHIKHGRARAAL